MWMLYLGVFLFAGAHLFSMLFPAARDKLVAHLGEGPYKGIFSLISVVGLVLLGMAYWSGRSAPDNLYAPIEGARHVAMALVFAGFILIFANGSKGYIRSTVRHPFSLGIALWAIAHLLANGEKTVVVIFGMFLVLAVLDIGLSLARGKRPAHEPSVGGDARALAVGIILYLVFLFGFHPYVLGIPVAG